MTILVHWMLLLPIAAGPATLPAAAPPVACQIDSTRSQIEFTITKFGFEDVTGVFRESEGEIQYESTRPAESRVRWRVRVASVLTDDPGRDDSLRQREYFDAARHPYLEFVSLEARPLPDGRLSVTGDLTMRGTTRRITIDVRPGLAEGAPAFETAFDVNRYDFGIAGGRVLGPLIGRTARVKVAARCRRTV